MSQIAQDLVEEWEPSVTYIEICVHSNTDPEDLPEADERDGYWPELVNWDQAQTVADEVRQELKRLFPRARVVTKVDEGDVAGLNFVTIETVDDWAGSTTFFSGYSGATALGPLGEGVASSPRAARMAALVTAIDELVDATRDSVAIDAEIDDLDGG